VRRPHGTVFLWGSLASCVPVANRHARRLPTAAQDAILPHRNRTFPHGHSARENLREAVALVLDASRAMSEQSLEGAVAIRETFVLPAA